MTKPLIDNSLSNKPCCFYTEADSREFPIMQVDSSDKEQPCSPGQLHDQTIPESLAMGFIGTAVCALQRRCEVCPRELKEVVSPGLIPFNQRK